MTRKLLFIVIAARTAACSSPAPSHPTPKPAPDAALARPAGSPDAATASEQAPAILPIGSACSPDKGCGAGRMCGPLPGGYCTSFCGVAGMGPCDGACVETARAGELCAAKCTDDSQCRASEGYTCDPVWHACLPPNSAAIVPKSCPVPSGPARDAAFGAVHALATSASPGIYQFEPAAALADDGSVSVVYSTRGKQIEGNVLGLARVDDKGAQPDQKFVAGRANNFDPWMARDAKGTLYAVWLSFDARDDQQISLSTSRDRGATWSAPVAVQDPADCKGEPDCLDKPMIAIGPDPKNKGAEIVYVLYAAEGLRVRASHDGGKTFGKTVTPLEGIFGNALVGADGRLHVVTLNGSPRGAFGDASHKVEYAVSADGGATFTRPMTISAAEEKLPFFFSNPSIAVDDARKATYVVYTRGGRDAVWDLVVASTRDAGKTWKRTRIGDDPACAIHMVPNTALDPTTGDLHVAWYDSRGGGRFAHAVCPTGATTCKQTGAINDAPFAALSTERHGAKWIGEYESLLVDNRRRLLHAVWSQPVSENGAAVARVFHAVAKLPAR